MVLLSLYLFIFLLFFENQPQPSNYGHDGYRESGSQPAPSPAIYPQYQHPQYSSQVQDQQRANFSNSIEKISDLVDKYWNGSKSLLANHKFLSMFAINDLLTVYNLLKKLKYYILG